jgi:hypothetical protein
MSVGFVVMGYENATVSNLDPTFLRQPNVDRCMKTYLPLRLKILCLFSSGPLVNGLQSS